MFLLSNDTTLDPLIMLLQGIMKYLRTHVFCPSQWMLNPRICGRHQHRSNAAAEDDDSVESYFRVSLTIPFWIICYPSLNTGIFMCNIALIVY